MECNKDEAVRAKEISEKKFLAKDIAGAKKFALKAQNLYPDLEGMSNMLATLDVYISAENKICGEADWYGILGVNPLADEQTIRKQYRKLALILHPDKNKSIGADGAFKLISEAWSFLSDKTKRLTYDQKRKAKVFQQKVQPPSGGSSAPPQPRSNGVFNFSKSTTSKAPKCNTTKQGGPSASASHKRKPATAPSHKGQQANVPSSSHKVNPTSFWTLCHRCMMQYEYLRMYLNRNLLCPNCHEPFLAIETNPPALNGSRVPTEWKYSAQQQNTNHQRESKNSASPNATSKGSNGPDSSSQTTNVQWGPFTKPTGAASAAQAANMVKQTYNKVKREREEAQAAIKREDALRRKNNAFGKSGSALSYGNSNASKRPRSMEDLGGGEDTMNQMGMGTGAISSNLSGLKEANVEKGRVSASKRSGVSDQSKNQDLLMEKARVVIRKKLNEWTSATEKEKDNASVNGVATEESIPGSSGKDPIQPISIDVPDSDFHDFDKDRTESCLGENQVWAAYDDDDGMPRFYAMIHNVISLDPFKMRISWLNSRTNSELGQVNWIDSGFSKTCGDFRIGKREISNSLNSFSHQVGWSKSALGAIQIYPRKGDVWALYKNWSSEWNELTEDEVIHKYEIVEVIEDYDEELGAAVTPLVKVAGFKTVFDQHLDLKQTRRIPREEMFRFSHHIPSYLLTGQEAPNAPKGCLELDPASTPFEFLQVIKKAAGTVENEEKLLNEENILNGVGEVNKQGRGESSSKDGKEIL
ncbi:hypothetical protein LguiA_000065 [Lonicera macranthoides]